MRFLTLLLFVLTTAPSFADSGNTWGVGGDSAEKMIKTIEQVVTVHADHLDQKTITLSNLYCLAGFDGTDTSYDCSISYDGEKLHFSGTVGEALFNLLKATGNQETMQAAGTSIEVKNLNCSTIVKHHGNGDYLSSSCSGEKVSAKY